MGAYDLGRGFDLGGSDTREGENGARISVWPLAVEIGLVQAVTELNARQRNELLIESTHLALPFFFNDERLRAYDEYRPHSSLADCITNTCGSICDRHSGIFGFKSASPAGWRAWKISAIHRKRDVISITSSMRTRFWYTHVALTRSERPRSRAEIHQGRRLC